MLSVGVWLAAYDASRVRLVTWTLESSKKRSESRRTLLSAFRRNALNLDSNIIVAERESNVMSILDTVACSMLLYVLALIDFARLELTRVPL